MAAQDKGEEKGKNRRRLSSDGRSLLSLTLYYAAIAAVIALLWPVSPLIQSAFSTQRLRELSGLTDQEITETFAGATPGLEGWQGYGLGVIIISVVGALLIMVPVAWSYIIIKRRGDYNESVVQTLIILPIAVTGIVLIVQNSIPLAFSLAGIVAAVRFRTTLKDVKDGVYVFLAIGVGLASGVQALGVAAVVSIFFNMVNLSLWWIDFGNIYADQRRRTGALGLGDMLAGPGSAKTALSIGDERLLAAMSDSDLRDVATRLARMERHLEADADSTKDQKSYSILMVHAKWVGLAQKIVEAQLDKMAFRWRLAEILPGQESTSMLEYLVRLKDTYRPGDLLDAIKREGATHVLAAEIRSLSGLRRKED